MGNSIMKLLALHPWSGWNAIGKHKEPGVDKNNLPFKEGIISTLLLKGMHFEADPKHVHLTKASFVHG